MFFHSLTLCAIVEHSRFWVQGVETSLTKQLNKNAYSQVVELDNKIGGKQVNSGRIGTCFFGRCGTRIGQSGDENYNLNAHGDCKPSLDENKTVNRRTEN